MEMKKTIQIIVSAALLLCACNNEVDVEVLKGEPKLVLYCFPNTEHDTTIIDLSRSLPASANVRDLAEGNFSVSRARVTYRVNGTERPVMFAEESNGYVPAGKYYTVGKHQCGDVVSISASADGYPDIHAETTIPDMPEIKDVKSAEVRRDGSNYIQKQITVGDNPQTDDFYAITVDDAICREVPLYDEQGLCRFDTVWTVTSTYVDINDEPALTPGSTLDEFFEYDNTFYRNFFIFNDHVFRGNEYTLRLNTLNAYYNAREENSLVASGMVYKLYRIAPGYYRFIKSVNDIANNYLGEYGMAPLSPNINNVAGGLGCVGGYSMAEYRDIKPLYNIRMSQDYIECDENAHSFDVQLLNYDSWQIHAVIGWSGNYVYSFDSMKFDGGWCTAEIPADNPRVLHIEMKAMDGSQEYSRMYVLEMQAGQRTGNLYIKQYRKD